MSTLPKAITINIVSHLLKKHKVNLIVIFLLLIGAFLRFYNLNWGSPFYFHPDERNIAGLTLSTSLSNYTSLLKGTFAYGNFPVILTLLLKPISLPLFQLLNITDPFAQSVIVLRFISAIFSVLMLYVIYLCGRFWSQKVALIGLFMSSFSTGFIQQAHFGTYDGFVTFCGVTVFYFLLRFLKTRAVFNFYFAIILIALGAAAKINLLVLAIFPIAILLAGFKKRKIDFLHVFNHSLSGIMLLLSLTALLSPNYITRDFRNALLYERGLVAGTTPVFYTQSFQDTTPIIFQFLHILPFLINPLLTTIFIPTFFYVLFKGIKTKNKSYLILTTFYLILFLPQALLQAKWTRYMVPTLPFIYLLISIVISRLLTRIKKVSGIGYLVLGIFLTVNILFGISYFVTAFVKPDSRVEASRFAQNNITQTAVVLTEPYDMGIIPFNPLFLKIDSFNFYDLDSENLAMEEELETKLTQSRYIILPSQRLLRSRVINKKNFPKGHAFYTKLINGELGKRIYETPCDIFCKIAYLGNPVFGFEETATVFDRPTVIIFMKI